MDPWEMPRLRDGGWALLALLLIAYGSHGLATGRSHLLDWPYRVEYSDTDARALGACWVSAGAYLWLRGSRLAVRWLGRWHPVAERLALVGMTVAMVIAVGRLALGLMR